METLILDYIVNNVMNNRKTVGKQISLMNSLFNNAFTLDITERDVEERIRTIKSYQAQLKKLMLLPKIEQRSDIWYATRKELITASDFAQAIGKGKFASQAQFYTSKCGYEESTFDNSIPALQWGVRYEEVANLFYQLKMGVQVHEFGLLRHPTIDFIGASPDGISKAGIMLEIKCPWKRKCTYTIPEQYYYQIQGQLEVCELDECDYLECFITEFSSYDEMIQDTTCKYKGQIWRTQDAYKYGRINDLEHACCDTDEVVCYYYGIRDYFLKRVYRDKDFFDNLVPQLREVWDNVTAYRNDEKLYRNSIKKRTVVKKPKFLFRSDGIEEDQS